MRQKVRRTNLSEISNFLVVGFGWIATIYSLFTSNESQEILPVSGTTLILAMLSLYFTSEFITRWQKMGDIHNAVIQGTAHLEEKISDVNTNTNRTRSRIIKDLGLRIPAKQLTEEDNIVNEIDYLQQRDLHSYLYVVIYDTIKSPPELAIRLSNLMKARESIKPIFVILKDFSTTPKNWFEDIEKRLKTSYGDVFERLNFFIRDVKDPVGIDTYIIDEKHVILNLADMTGDINRKILIIENIEIIAKEYVSWYGREVLTKDRMSLDDAKKHWASLQENK